VTTRQERINKWIDALKSDDYKQTTGALVNRSPENDYEGFCCIGVWCEIDERVTWQGKTAIMVPDQSTTEFLTPLMLELGLRSGAGDFYHPWKYDGDEMDWVDISKIDDDRFRYLLDSLVDLNDAASFTFTQIADAIETAPKGAIFRPTGWTE